MAIAGFDRSLLLIGCGNMAGAMVTRWIAAGLEPSRIHVVRPSGRSVASGVQVSTTLAKAPHAPDTIVMLGFKPAQRHDILAAAAPRLADCPVLSILAGVTLNSLRQSLPQARSIVRLMPNMPVAIGKGVTAVHADDALDSATRQSVDALLVPLGLVEWIADEAQFDLVTALSGCGPAFVYRFIDALAQAATELGLPADQALRLARATVEGGASVAANAHDSPSTLADAVASPGGMTREGLNILDADGRLATLMVDVLRAARDRGVTLNRAPD